MTQHPSPVLQLRLIVDAEDHDAAVRFYRDVLGLREQIAFEGSGDARVAILEAGRATLELANSTQRQLIDEVEVGRATGPGLRIAFEVANTVETADRLAAAGATVVATPRETPWRSLNARLEGPGGLQITLFQELETLEDRASRAEFDTLAGRRGRDPSR